MDMIRINQFLEQEFEDTYKDVSSLAGCDPATNSESRYNVTKIITHKSFESFKLIAECNR